MKKISVDKFTIYGKRYDRYNLSLLIAKNVKRLLEENNMTCADLARLLELKNDSLSRKINTTLITEHANNDNYTICSFNLLELYKISKVLDISFDEFFKN